MENASRDTLATIMLSLDFDHLNNVAVSQTLSSEVRAVTESNYFWYQKLLYDFNILASNCSRDNKTLYFDLWLLSDSNGKRKLFTEAIRCHRIDLVGLLLKSTEVIITDLELALEVGSKSIYEVLCRNYVISPEFRVHLRCKFPHYSRLINKTP